MRRTRQQLTSLVVSLLALATVGAALAWACTPSADIAVSSSAVEPGQTVTITGELFVAGGNVELRWNSAGGPILATATGPAFTVQATIPAAQADTHTIFAIGLNTDGSFAGSATAAVRIGPAPAPAADGAGTSRETAGGSAPGDVPRTAAPDSSTAPRPAAERSTNPATAADGAGARNRTSARASGREPARGLGASPSRVAAGRASGPVLVSAQAVIPGSVPRTAGTRAAAGDRSPAVSGRPAPAISSEGSAFADVWSGFAAPSAASLATRSSEAVVAAGRGNGGFIVALLGIGLTALVATGVALQTRRRRFLGH